MKAAMGRSMLRTMCRTILLLIFSVVAVHAEKLWYPVEVDVWEPPFANTLQRGIESYAPLKKAQRKWRIHVFIPHLKDAYWLGVNYGFIDEARRLGVKLSIFEAGGYDRLHIQRRQIEEGLAQKPDGLIVGAISYDGLNDILQNLHDSGTPIVDSINGISPKVITARVAADFRDLGLQTGAYLIRLQEKSEKPLSVAWFPGPKGAGWVEAGDRGFKTAIQESSVRIVASQYGDTGIAVQKKLVGTVLDRHADVLDVVVGTAATAEAAVKVLKRRGLSKRIKVLSYYYSPGVHRGIRRGKILAAPTDQPVLQARIAVDVMVRILEKKNYFKHSAPRVMLVDGGNVKQWDSTSTLAPRGFRPIFSND